MHGDQVILLLLNPFDDLEINQDLDLSISLIRIL